MNNTTYSSSDFFDDEFVEGYDPTAEIDEWYDESEGLDDSGFDPMDEFEESFDFDFDDAEFEEGFDVTEGLDEWDKPSTETQEAPAETDESPAESDDTSAENSNTSAESDDSTAATKEKVAEKYKKVGAARENVGPTEEKVLVLEEKAGAAREKAAATEEKVAEKREKVAATEENVGATEEKALISEERAGAARETPAATQETRDGRDILEAAGAQRGASQAGASQAGASQAGASQTASSGTDRPLSYRERLVAAAEANAAGAGSSQAGSSQTGSADRKKECERRGQNSTPMLATSKPALSTLQPGSHLVSRDLSSSASHLSTGLRGGVSLGVVGAPHPSSLISVSLYVDPSPIGCSISSSKVPLRASDLVNAVHTGAFSLEKGGGQLTVNQTSDSGLEDKRGVARGSSPSADAVTDTSINGKMYLDELPITTSQSRLLEGVPTPSRQLLNHLIHSSVISSTDSTWVPVYWALMRRDITNCPRITQHVWEPLKEKGWVAVKDYTARRKSREFQLTDTFWDEWHADWPYSGRPARL